MFRAAFSLLIPVLTAMSAAAAESGVNGSTGNNGTTGSSTMTDPYANFNTLREQNQGLFLWEGNARFETPGSVNIDFRIVQWWCSFEFTSTNLLFDGYYARSVEIHLDDVEKEITEQGAGDGTYAAL